ncbi:ComF family protein [Bacteroidales bacterium]|nr:ComF family protein [Bacteroidales bacterium]
MLAFIKSVFNNISDIIYPECCIICNALLIDNEKHLCKNCLANLPYTQYHNDVENITEQSFWGRINPYAATSLLRFYKKGITQEIIHHIKYKKGKSLGKFMGCQFAEQLLNSRFASIDYIIPVPLHRKKQISRGYNQVEEIAKGMTGILNAPILTNILYRVKQSGSQTLRHRFQRYENVKDLYDIKNLNLLDHKHILLLDDVITTGATIEVCFNLLHKNTSCKISVASLAMAVKS